MAHPDSTSSINYDDINHAKHHQQHIENLEKLKPTPSQFEKLYLAPETPVAGATLTPFFNVINGYNDDSPAFYRSFAMFLMYFYAADGLVALSNTTRIAGGYFSFIASIIAWYLWFSMVLESVDFPIALPVGDLTKYVKGRSERLKSAAEMA
ncbi:hypothetical protein CBER1_07282 [Cercospora berteroae]|uniref:Uncharacterized protein n=1 Tax=Cercospora berteroae TaxID=357750 RepID=A0A2S6BTP8_9PEZI|nr:hypothetical protein CBER1_07282 [Cercospora berteroae]